MAKHTHGPWKVVRYPHSPHRIYVRGGVSDNWPEGTTDIWHAQERKRGSHRGETAQWIGFMPEDEANAHLIAAAPELLEALTGLMEYLPDRNDALNYAATNEGRVGSVHLAVAKAYAAIQKAAPRD